MNLLIVDDEPKIRRGLRSIIDWGKYDISVSALAANGVEALNIIEKSENNIRIVLTDVEMPEMDGIELSRELRERYPGIRVLILSGYDNFDYARGALKYGVKNYLLKPVDEEELLETVLKIKKDIEEQDLTYPGTFEKELIQFITDCREDDLKVSVESLFSYFSNERCNMEQMKEILNLLFLKIEENVLPDGVSYWDISKNDDYKKMILNSETADDLKSCFLQCLLFFTDHNAGSQSYTIMSQIKNYIRLNINSDLTLSIVAGQFLLNPSYLSQLFKKHYDGGFSAYIVDLKIEKAKRLLLDEKIKIADIGEIVGYNDVKYFSRLFKKKTGKLPSEYRKSKMEG